MLAEAYRGRSILLTGGTGFLGTALVEKILRGLPELGRLYLLIRASRDRSALPGSRGTCSAPPPCANCARSGEDFEEHVARKVRVLEGDVQAPSLGLGEEDLAQLAREVDVVIHSAASVVFDAPLDAAVESNVRGTLGLLRLARGWGKKPLFLHVSTAYVAGMQEGFAPEEPPGNASPNGTPLDPYEEVASLEGVVGEVEEASRERGPDPALRDGGQAGARDGRRGGGGRREDGPTQAGLDARAPRRARHAARPRPGLARRLHFHKVPGRADGGEGARRRAARDREACDHRE